MNYTLGIKISGILSLTISLIFILTYLSKKPWIKNSERLPINESGYNLMIGLFVFYISSMTFCFSYTFSNMILNYDFLKDNFSETVLNELSNGVLAMRFSSITLGYSVIITLRKITRMTPFPNKKTEKEYKNYNEATKIGLPYFQTTRNRFEHYFLNLTQNSYYSLVLTSLWILYFYEIDSISSVLLSYFLFMIIDDWTIIYSYSLRLKGLIINSHFIKILVLNIVLLITGIISTSEIFILQITFSLFALFILIINYLNYSKRLFFRVKYEFEKNISP